jgi:xanthosine utilization system XapX-like protein
MAGLGEDMRYYLAFVMLGLLMGALCLLLEVRMAAPSVAMTGLFGAGGPAHVPPPALQVLEDTALPA